ncbi:MAG: hypothetical protein QOG72_1940 [Sphingomonadales bacterium]|nr:hypothetical protein [Sphingomonadales bacterium]
MRLALAFALICVLALPATAEATIEVASERFDNSFNPPGTLVIRVSGSANLRIEHSTSSDEYALIAESGGPILEGSIAGGDDIEDPPACLGLNTNTVTCKDTEVPGIGEVIEAPYRIRVETSGAAGTLQLDVNGPGDTQDADVVFPAADFRVVPANSTPVITDNDTGTPMTVLSSPGAQDIFHPGAGNDTFMGASTDQVFYDNTFGIGGRCAVVSLDGIANDTMRTSGCVTGPPGAATETDNISAGTVFGTGSADNVTGSNAAETLNGLGGNDRLLGAAGSDSLHGGAGDDLLDGGGSSDDLFAEGDGATMIGSAGSDDFFGTATGGGVVSYDDKTAPVSATFDGVANDGLVDDGIAPGPQTEGDNIDDNVITVIGGSAADDLSAVDAPAARSLDGGPGNDTITGGPGNDGLLGGDGDDTLDDVSASSNDVFVPGPGDDSYTDSGDSGSPNPEIGDRLDYTSDSAGVSLSVNGTGDDGEPGSTETVGSDFEILAGGSGDDDITGSNAANTLFGLAGDDVLSGLAGNDVINGGDGTAASGCDTIQPGLGDDLIDADLGCRDLVDYSVAHANAVQIVLGNSSSTQDIDPTAGVENETFQDPDVDMRGSPSADNINFSASTSPHKLLGGPGTVVDTLIGGSANDILVGEPGNDPLNGAGGTDVSSYEDRSAAITATVGTGADGDPLLSEADAFTSIEGLTGGTGTDTLTGDGAANPLSGGGGSDLLVGSLGNDPLDGGSGNDAASYEDRTADITATLGAGNDGDPLLSEADQYTSIENLTGGTGKDKLSGNSIANTLKGGGNDDVLVGGTGNDPLDGGSGTDASSYEDRSADITATIGTGADGDPLLSEADAFTSIEGLTGGTGTDTLTGNASPNPLTGGGGNDTLIGGLGNDPLDGGSGTADVSSYQDRSAAITATLGAGNDGDPALTEADAFTGIEGLTGGTGADTLTGDTGPNPLTGREGADQLQGLNGADTLTGGTGDDQLDGGGDTDVSSYADRTASITATLGAGPDGDPLLSEADAFTSIEGLTGGSSADTLTGDAGANPLSGGGAPDVLIGGTGNDPLDGGSGADTVSYQDRSAKIVATLGAGPDGDPLLGEADAFTSIEALTGGSGSDTLTGDAAVNALSGAGGNDTINSRDSVADGVACGTGSDSVTSDTLDEVNADCEVVDDGTPKPLPLRPPPAAPGRDTAAPVLTLSVSKRQKIAKGKRIVLTVTSNESATLTAAASLSIPGQAKRFKLKAVRRTLRARVKTKLTVKLSKKTVRRVKRALRKRRRVRATLTITARDAAGNVARAKRTVTARR